MRRALLIVLTLAYPLLVYLSIGRIEPRLFAGVLLLLALLRFTAKTDPFARLSALALLVLALVASQVNGALPLKLYPVVVNASMLVLFALSLRHPPSVIERLARLRHPDLPPSGVAYTARVTRVWCGFFVLNGSIALATALWGSDAVWTLYNGLIAYLLMGVLFVGEWLVRRRVMAAQSHG